MDIKVFVSSTYVDLKAHRQQVIARLRHAGYHVDPMEDWTSDADEPRRLSLDRLDGCQVCVLLVGFRRGFVPPGHTRSITQMEYDHASACGIDVLPFLLDDGVTGWPQPYDDRTTDAQLPAWREHLGTHHVIKPFTADPTSVDVLPALSRWQMKAAGLKAAALPQVDDIIVGGPTRRGVTTLPPPRDTRRSNPASRNRRAMIEKVWAIWITGVLQPSLPQDILLELGLTERPAMVSRAFDLFVQPDLADQVQAPGTPLIDVFDRLDRALLVLGAPGAGKTTLLLTLARDLLRRAAQDPEQPIPVIFPLSSWAARLGPLAAWLVDELQQRYDVPRQIGQAWIDADQVLPLLDGLDEVQSEHRAACAEAINTFRQDHGLLPLAVCSRIMEYEALGLQLRLQGAIVVQPLTRAQVDSYLTQIGEPLAAVRQVLQEDSLLWELLDTPLMLTIVTLAYAGQPAEALHTRGTLAERRQSLFATYVNRMFQRRSAVTRYTRQQAERWLAWLAWQLTQHGQISFPLERLQPDWLPVGRRWLPTQGARLLAALVGLLAGPLVGLAVGLFAELGLGPVSGLIAACIGALTGYSREITPTETVHWSRSEFFLKLLLPSRRGLLGGLGIGLASGLGMGLFIQLIGAVTDGPLTGTLAGRPGVVLLGGLLGGLAGALVGGLGIGLFSVLLGGLAVGGRAGLRLELSAGLSAELIAWMSNNPSIGPFIPSIWILIPSLGLFMGMLSGLVYKLHTGITAGLSGGEITTKTTPNEGIHRSGRMAIYSGLGSGLSVGLLVGLPFGLVGQWLAGVGVGLIFGVLVGVATCSKYGGRACLQHLVLRVSLRYYDCMPRRYVNFLDYAAGRLLLRRVGGSYIFIHPLLQEYFATMYQPDRVDSPPQPPPPPP